MWSHCSYCFSVHVEWNGTSLIEPFIFKPSLIKDIFQKEPNHTVQIESLTSLLRKIRIKLLGVIDNRVNITRCVYGLILFSVPKCPLCMTTNMTIREFKIYKRMHHNVLNALFLVCKIDHKIHEKSHPTKIFLLL